MAKRRVRGKEAKAGKRPTRDCFEVLWQLTLEKYGPAAHAPLRRDVVRVIRGKPDRRNRKR